MGTVDKRNNLKAVFNPCAVAVIGASENPGKLGCHVMKSLKKGGYNGTIVPINPGGQEIWGLPSCASITEYSGHIDLAIVVLPAKLVPSVFKECVEKGVKGVVLITAGFKEIEDPVGEALQTEIRTIADQADMPVIGPNTFGMINYYNNLNASFTPEFSWAIKGGVSLVSQSGGMSHLMAFTAMRQNFGFSKIVGLGNRLNISFEDMVDFLMDDPDTRVISLYVEGVEDPRRLMLEVKKHRGKKPVVAFKSGSAETGNQASLSHTGTLAGRHEIYTGAFRQAGICSVDNAQTLLELSNALATCSLPAGPRVAVLSGQAGPGMEACDACESHGLEIVTFSEKTQQAINELLPPLALRSNPVDMGPAWYNPAAVQGIVRAVLEDDHVDGLLLLTVYASANWELVSFLTDTLQKWQQKKPVITCFSAPPGIWEDEIKALELSGAIVNLPTPERAAKIMSYLWQYQQIKQPVWSES